MRERIRHPGVYGRVCHCRLRVHRDPWIAVGEHLVHERVRHPVIVAGAEVDHPRIVVDAVARPGEISVLRIRGDEPCRRGQGGVDLSLGRGRVHVREPHRQADANRVGEPLPSCRAATEEGIRRAELDRSGWCPGHGGGGRIQVREQAGVDVLLRVVFGRDRAAVSAQGLGVRHVAPDIGDVAEHQAAQHLGRTPQQRLVLGLADVDDGLEVLQILRIRADEVAIRVTRAEAPVGVLIRVLDLGQVLHGELGSPQIHGAPAEPAAHRQARGAREHRSRRSGGGIVGILIDVGQGVAVAGAHAQRDQRRDAGKAKYSGGHHGTILRLNPMLRGFDGIMYSMPWKLPLL